MTKRGLALILVLGMASVAQAGAVVELVPTAPGPWPPGSVVTLEVMLHQDPVGGDHLLRLVQLDFSGTDAEFGLGPVTWSATTNHYLETDIAGGRPNLVAMAHHGKTTAPVFLGPDPAVQVLMPGNGSSVKVAEFDVTMPDPEGDYCVNVTGPSAGVIFGFACDSGSACDNGDPDATYPITVWDLTGPAWCPAGGPPEVLTWESIATHLQGVGDVALEVTPTTGGFSEPRLCAIGRLRATCSSAIEPSTAIPANVVVGGAYCDGGAVDLSGITKTVTLLAADTQLEISFSPTLPDNACYRVTLSGVEAVGGVPIAGVTEVIISGLLGDATGDNRVRANDVGGVRSLVGTEPIDPTNLLHVRSDATCDGRIRANDVGGIRSVVNHNCQACTPP